MTAVTLSSTVSTPPPVAATVSPTSPATSVDDPTTSGPTDTSTDTTTSEGPTPTSTQTSEQPNTSTQAPPVTTATQTVTPPTTTKTSTVTTTSTQTRWVSQPAATSGDIPWGLAVTGLLIVIAATVACLVWFRKTRAAGRRAFGRATDQTAAPERASATDATEVVVDGPSLGREVAGAAPNAQLLAFMTMLGEAMLDISAPMAQVNHTLRKVAVANGVPNASIITLPTALFVSLPGVEGSGTAAIAAGERAVDLGQMHSIMDVADQSSSGQLAPADGIARLTAIADARSPYPPLVQIAGYAAMSVGIALLLGAAPVDLIVAAVLGSLTAVVLRATAGISTVYSAMVVLGTSFSVATITFLVARTGWDLNPLAALVPPLLTFLPGAQLTNGTIDLATSQIVSGAARLAAGFMQLVLLAVGITAAASLVGVPAGLVEGARQSSLGPVAPWLGVLVYGTGLVFYKAARKGSRRWILLVLVIAYAGQVVGGLLFGSAVSALFGAFCMTPAAMIVSTRPTGPPPLVSFLPAFWMMVPGALGLVGVTTALGGQSAANTFITMATTLVSISLGVLAGLALARPFEDRLQEMN